MSTPGAATRHDAHGHAPVTLLRVSGEVLPARGIGVPVARGRRTAREAGSTWAWHSSLLTGAAMLAVLASAAALADALAPDGPLRAMGAPLQPPMPQHWLGTDDLGRDVFARLVHGARVSLAIGFLTALVSAVIGTLVGSVAGYMGHWVDDVLMRLTELVQVLPRFFLAIVVVALFDSSAWLIVALLGLTFWPGTARLLRAQVLSLREREFVLAARAVGMGEVRVLWRHILPNALPLVLVTAALQVGTAMLVESALSFLGLGDQAVVSWGGMLSGAQAFVRTAWWTSVFPGLAIVLTVLAANLVADGLQDALDPRQPAASDGGPRRPAHRAPRRLDG